MYSLHAYNRGHFITVAYCFLPHKEQATYEKMLGFFSDICKFYDNPESLNVPKEKCEFKPNQFHIDFEKGAIGAVEKMFPDTKVVGCRFHLAQAWLRWLMRKYHGLFIHYCLQDDIGKGIKSVLGLSYLPPEKVQYGIFVLIMDIPSHKLEPWIR